MSATLDLNETYRFILAIVLRSPTRIARHDEYMSLLAVPHFGLASQPPVDGSHLWHDNEDGYEVEMIMAADRTSIRVVAHGPAELQVLGTDAFLYTDSLCSAAPLLAALLYAIDHRHNLYARGMWQQICTRARRDAREMSQA